MAMAIRDDVLFPGYDVVAKTDQVTVSFFDYGNSKDDAIQVQLNEEIIVSFLDIASGTKSVDLDINAGENRLRIVGAADRDFPVTVGMTFDSADVYSEYNDAPRTFNILLEEGITFTLGLPVIRVDGDLYPQSAQHIIDTLGEPTVTKVKRADNNSRRRTVTDRWRNINGNVPLGYQVDESLPVSTHRQ
ncbi:MAG: hypothetical protein HC812_09055 [Leptolyngbya sp. RL_3_1]|nr:hypothetical protein [Leptolyngbya sp. RL_3_1]